MKRFLLKQKIAVLLIIVSIISMITIGFTVYSYINNVLVENKKVEINNAATEQSHESILTFRNNQLFIHMLSIQEEAREYLLDKSEINQKKLFNLFLDHTENDKKYLAIYLLDTNGIGLISTDSRFIGQDYSFRKYFKDALEGKDSLDFAVGKTSNQIGFYFSSPIKNDNGDILGVIVVKVDQSDIDSSIDSSKLDDENILMLVDEFGVIISSNNKDRLLKSLGEFNDEEKKIISDNNKYNHTEIIPIQYSKVKEAIKNYNAPKLIEFYDETDDDKEFFSIIKLDDLPFYLVTEIRLNALVNQALNTVVFIIFINSLILIILSFFIFYFLRLFIRPIDKFINFFNDISNGNFSNKLEIDTKDEFNDMAIRVNKMAKDLSDLYKNLDEKVNKQTLDIENKVKEAGEQNRAILNILEDVESEKLNAENLANDLEKFKLAVENASDQIVITDVDGIVIYGNNAVEKITGYKPEEALGKKAGFLWKMPMPNDYYENLWDIIKNKKQTFIGEIQNKRKSGELYTAILSISSVFDKNDNIIYFVAIERDITREKEIDKAKTEFVSLASHQLRTPLSAINWYTEMLLAGDAGVLNDEQKNYINEVSVGNKRMVELVNDLLNVSRLDMGTFFIDTKDINIIDLWKSVLLESKSQIIAKKLNIEENIGDNIPQTSADEKLLRMIYQNLLSNAIKYTDISGTIKINILKINPGDTFGNKTINEESLAFSMSDSGMGIPLFQQEKIFSKLFRADNVKSSDTEGTGLGLYVVKSIVDKSGGLIWFDSEEGKGTAFYVIFPISGMKSIKKLDL